MDGRKILKLGSNYAIMTWRFPIWYFIECCTERVQVYVCLKTLFEFLSLFPHYLSIQLFCNVLSVPYFTLFHFLCIRLLICFRAFSIEVLVEFSFFLISCFACIIWPCASIIWVSFFTNIFWFISSSGTFRIVSCFLVLFISIYICVFSFLCTFVCWRSFFTCTSSLISHSGFIFLLKFSKGNPILLLTSFAPA